MQAAPRKLGRTWLLAIAFFKLVKATALVAGGILAWRLVGDDDSARDLGKWAALLSVDPDNRFVHTLLADIAGLSPVRLEELSAGSFAYAAVFLTEGVGLFLAKRWAEYMTIGVTISFIPIEVFEAVHKPTILRGLTIVVNVAVVAYLLWRVRRERRLERAELLPTPVT